MFSLRRTKLGVVCLELTLILAFVIMNLFGV